MNREESTTTNRLVFFDNLRYLMVLLVLVFHSGVNYGTMVAFWPYHDTNPSEFLDHLMMLPEIIMMPILFFIAGYFALPSLQKKGGRGFLASKLKRLGIPWLAVTVMILPILDYIHYYSQSKGSGQTPAGFAVHWLLSMKKLTEFRVGVMDMSEYLNMTEHFYQRYVWFLSLLLLFFVLFRLLYEANKKWGWISARSKDPTSHKPIYGPFLLVGVLTVLLFGLAYFLTFSNPLEMATFWFSLGNVIQFQPAKLVFYTTYFGLGVYAYSRKWFTKGTDLGRPWVWGLICFLLMGVNLPVARTLSRIADPPLGPRIAFVILYPFLTLSFLGLFVAFASRRWNRSTTFGRELAAHSYNMYLVHYVFVLTLPLLLSAWTGGPVMVKFGIVALTTVFLSYGVSRYIIKPYPRWTVIAIVASFLVMMVIA